MPSSKLILMVHVDALRPDYITKADMPFLYRLGQQGVVTRFIPPFGFEPDGTYLTGANPEQYQGGAHFIYRESGPPLPGTSWLPGWLDHFSPYLQYPLRRRLGDLDQAGLSSAYTSGRLNSMTASICRPSATTVWRRLTTRWTCNRS